MAKKKVTLGDTGTVDNPEELPYYMAAVEEGYAGTRQRDPMVLSGEEDAPPPDTGERQESTVQEEDGGDQEGAVEQAVEGLEEL